MKRSPRKISQPFSATRRILDYKPLGLGNRNAIDGLIACHAVIIDATAGEMWQTPPGRMRKAEFIGINVSAMLGRNANAENPGIACLPRTRIPADSIP